MIQTEKDSLSIGFIQWEKQLTRTASVCMTNPSMSKSISPYDANETPAEIARTMAMSFWFGSLNPKAKEIRRMATGVKAWYTMIRIEVIVEYQWLRTHFEHLNEGY
jgi:hypothetical protein